MYKLNRLNLFLCFLPIVFQPCAMPTYPTSLWRYMQIIPTKRMASLAMSFMCILAHRIVVFVGMLFYCQQLQMLWIYTTWVFAKVVNMSSFWSFSFVNLIAQTVRTYAQSFAFYLKVKAGISYFICKKHPLPTTIFCNLYSGFQVLLKCRTSFATQVNVFLMSQFPSFFRGMLCCSAFNLFSFQDISHCLLVAIIFSRKNASRLTRFVFSANMGFLLLVESPISHKLYYRNNITVCN